MIPPEAMATVRPAVRVCSVFEASGLRPAEAAGPPGPAEDAAGEVRTIREPALPEISDRMSCSACGCSFESREEQTEHYRLDWHRFNLSRRLMGAQSVSAENFETIAGEISSISGSDSEELDLHPEPEGLYCHHMLDVSEPGSGISSCEEKAQGRRSTRVLFRTAEGELLSVFRCVLQGKQITREDEDSNILASLLSLTPETIWVILMAGGGHFAGAVFRGDVVIHHKTFHRYTVRAKRGSAQGAWDGQNRNHAPKSAGASLRRHNEAALVKEIEDLLLVWTEYLQAASAIFLRAPSHNRGIFLGGKVPALNRGDSRLRSIPFSTRRATFKEVKRVHAALSTVEIYAADTDFTTIHSPQRRVWKKQLKSAEDALCSDRDECVDVDINPSDLPTALEVVEETLGTLDLREFEVSPKKKRGKKKKKVSAEKGIHQEDAAPEINRETDLLPTREEVKGKTQRDVIGAIPADAAGEVRNDLYTACRTGDVERLRDLLRHLLPAHVLEPGCSSPTPDTGRNPEQIADDGQNPEQTPDDRENPEQAPDNRRNPEQIADDRQNPEQIADDRQNPEQTPDDRQNPEQTPDNRRSPEQIADDRQNPEQIADDRQNPEQTPDDRQNPEQTPDDRENPEQTPDNRRNPEQIADDRQNPEQTPDDRQNPEQTPDNRRNQEQIPDDRQNPEQTPNCGQNQEQTSDSGQTQQQTSGNGAGPSGATVVMWGTLGDGGLGPGPVTTDVLNDPVDESGFTLLHVAAAAAEGSVLRLLLDAGCDPARRDKRGRPAYTVSADRDTRNEFRRYMANHPGRYDYVKAQISTPLTCELEAQKAAKKRAQKTARKLREKERREEKKRLEEEEMERKMFLALSEREKRALAAEKRFTQQLVSNGAVPTDRRCWLCGQSLAGRVPFEYLDYSFCTTRCLQEHRRQQTL
ncbi:tRNA endonuclease ANKZF1-like isoform X2 [Mobula hypostoma]|uniref:tRNA endonuclease ANKZF1-like isoform X2 n=1 Tax=Mobula hypostoma TaxID=723540 RepID=UPI002FC35FB8